MSDKDTAAQKKLEQAKVEAVRAAWGLVAVAVTLEWEYKALNEEYLDKTGDQGLKSKKKKQADRDEALELERKMAFKKNLFLEKGCVLLAFVFSCRRGLKLQVAGA